MSVFICVHSLTACNNCKGGWTVLIQRATEIDSRRHQFMVSTFFSPTPCRPAELATTLRASEFWFYLTPVLLLLELSFTGFTYCISFIHLIL